MNITTFWAYVVLEGRTFGGTRDCLVTTKDYQRAKDERGNLDLLQIVRLAAKEDVFDIVLEHHLQTHHAAGRNTWESVKTKYCNISRKICQDFVALCTCKVNARSSTRPEGVKPIISKTLNDRAQIDLIDMQAQVFDGYTWILHYQDHLTKFSYLRALKNKESASVACELLSIWCIQGAPMILQSDNGREFVSAILREVVGMWEGVKIVHGRPRHPQSQGSVERANQDVEIMLGQWMTDNKT